jgi:hypothetical protein
MSRIILIGCGKQKRATACEAKDLYIGKLFKARREFAERSGRAWLIVSALHGLIVPERVIDPYDKTMPTQRHAVERWAETFKRQFCSTVGVGHQVTLEVHAGVDYVAPIRLALWSCPAITIEHPVFGMGIGEQIKFYLRRL